MMKPRLTRLIGLFFFCTLLFSSLKAQDIYKLSTGVDVPLISGGAAGIALSFPLNKKIKPFSPEQLIAFDTMAIHLNAFDRIATKTYSKKAQKGSDIFLKYSPVLPLALLADQGPRNEFGKISLMYFETALVNYGITELTKVFAKRTRPYVYNPTVKQKQKMIKDARKSFFSGHTSHVAATSFFTAKVLSDSHPGDDLLPVYWVSAAVIPAITALQRVKGGKHFPTDVIVGYVVGALVGVLVPELHKL